MEIKEVAIEKLQVAEYNPRTLTEIQYAQLRESIEKFGLVDPIIVNSYEGRENVVIGGHQRLKIASDLGFSTVPVHYVNLDPEKEKELNLRLNKNTGQWDFEMLANHFDPDTLMGIGFTEQELGLDLTIKEEDDVPPSDDSLRTVTGDIRQVIVFVQPEEYEKTIEKLNEFVAAGHGEDHSDVILKLIHETDIPESA